MKSNSPETRKLKQKTLPKRDRNMRAKKEKELSYAQAQIRILAEEAEMIRRNKLK